MKKFLLLLVCCFTLLGLAGCDSATGTWKFEQKTSSLTGTITTANDEGFSKDYLVIELKNDGTGTLSGDYFGETKACTWSQNDEGVIRIEAGLLVKFDAKVEDGCLVFTILTETFKLKKSLF